MCHLHLWLTVIECVNQCTSECIESGCVGMCVCAEAYIWMRGCANICMYVCVFKCACLWMSECVHVCVSEWAHVHVWVTQVSVLVHGACVWMCEYVCCLQCPVLAARSSNTWALPSDKKIWGSCPSTALVTEKGERCSQVGAEQTHWCHCLPHSLAHCMWVLPPIGVLWVFLFS